MKTFEILLITPNGLITEIYTDNEPLQDFENRMIKKHKTFIMQTCNEL